VDEFARGILYHDFLEFYTWHSSGKFRKRRVYEGRKQVGRIVSAHSVEGERYYLRVLLNHVVGATSFNHLKMVDGVVQPTFREAAERRGLIEEDNTLDECLTEASMFQMPSSLLRLFATILVFCESSDVFGLWQKHLDAMSEDYRPNNPSPGLATQMVLTDIRNMLQSMGKDIKTFPLPDIDETYDDANGIPREISEEASIGINTDDVSLVDSLNPEQRDTYQEIILTIDSDQGGLFFLDGPSGTGETFLYRPLLATLQRQNMLVVATATSGVAVQK
jgi:ATP-dependent DNA helicase PIF1